MKIALIWIKGNPITLVSGLVALASVGVIVYAFIAAGGLKNQALEDAKVLDKINRLQRASVDLPAPNPNEPPITEQVVVNDQVIETVKTLFDSLRGEFDQSLEMFLDSNRGDHPDMLMIEGLLPAPPSQTARFEARAKYRAIYEGFFDEKHPLEDWPSIAAGPPIDPELVMQRQSAAMIDFRASLGDTVVSEQDYDRYLQEQRNTLLEQLREHADGISLYTQSDPRIAAAFPFQLGDWSKLDNPPANTDLWEAQLELWIVSDLIRAIANTNADPDNSEGGFLPVYRAPIKSLISVEILPGYVGLHSVGGLVGDAETPPRYNPIGQGAASGGAMRGFTGSSSSANVGVAPGVGYPAPPSNAYLGSIKNPLADNFYFSPTGRASNTLFDVKHVRLRAHIAWQELPRFIQELADVNLMSVLELETVDVDEYALLRDQLLLYGEDDVVEVNMLIETIWARGWTKQFMPEEVRTYLGVKADAPATGAAGPTGIPASGRSRR